MPLRRLAAEFVGALALVAAIVGSGIAASRLSPSDTGLQLLENALATAAALYVLILVLQPISGAHFNPVVSGVDAALGNRRWADALAYIAAQIAGAIAGSVLANLMFALDPVSISTQHRFTWPHALAEFVATAGLVMVIFVLVRTCRTRYVAGAVAAYIGGAYFATSSTSFANPAVTLGRIFSDTFAGIEPWSALGFIGAQVAGGAFGLALVFLLTRTDSAEGHSVKPKASTGTYGSATST